MHEGRALVMMTGSDPDAFYLSLEVGGERHSFTFDPSEAARLRYELMARRNVATPALTSAPMVANPGVVTVGPAGPREPSRHNPALSD